MTLRTPNTSWLALASVLISVRDRFLFGFTTTSPQCFGTVPDAPEVGRLGGDVRWADVTSVVVSVVCDGTGDAEIGVWRVAWGRRCGCGWMDQISMTELRDMISMNSVPTRS